MRFEALVKWWLKASYDFSDVRCEFIERPTGTIVRSRRDTRRELLPPLGDRHSANDRGDRGRSACSCDSASPRASRVAPPVHRRDGAYAGAFPAPAGSCAAVLFHEARGMAVERPTRQQAQALGTLIAEIHTAGRELRLPSRPRLDGEYLAVAPVRHTEYWLRKHGLDVGRVLAIAEEMQAAIWQINALESGFCHGDVHLGNVRFVDVGPTIFDLRQLRCWPLRIRCRLLLAQARFRRCRSRTCCTSVEGVPGWIWKRSVAQRPRVSDGTGAGDPSRDMGYGASCTSWRQVGRGLAVGDASYFETHLNTIARFAERARQNGP